MMHIDLSKYSLFSEAKNVALKLFPDQGFSNTNYSFTYKNTKYHLRCFKLTDRDRENEFNIQNMAYEKHLAAKAIVLDLEEGLMIGEFLKGEHKQTLTKEDLKLFIMQLKILHNMHIEEPGLELRSLFASPSDEIQSELKAIEAFPPETVLCHNDLNPKNLLFYKETLKFIDWEFAGMNDRYFDLAALSVEFTLEDLDEVYMLENYFGNKDWNKDKLNAYKVIYKALCSQWFNENL